MKFLCGGCEQLVPLELKKDGADARITCPACGKSERLRVSEVEAAPVPVIAPVPSPPVEDPFTAPRGHCPKCGTKHPPGAAACLRCGLVFERAPLLDLAPSEWLAARWRELIATWEEPAAHDALREASRAKGELADLGRLYAFRLARAPRDPLALQGREEILRVATLEAQSRLTPTTADAEPKWDKRWLLLAALPLLAAALWLASLVLK